MDILPTNLRVIAHKDQWVFVFYLNGRPSRSGAHGSTSIHHVDDEEQDPKHPRGDA